MEIFNFLDREIFGNSVYRYILLFLTILIGFVVARTVEYLLGHKLAKLAQKTTTKLDDVAIEIIKKPLKYIILLLALKIGSGFLLIPEKVEGITDNIFNVLVAAVVTYVLLRMVDLFMAYLEPKISATESKLDDQLLPILRKTLKVFIVIIAILVIIQNMGYNIMSLLAGLGLGGLAVALAAKDTLSNLFGSITIFADRPFHVGDRVQVEGYDGSVETVGLRSTRIRTLDGTLVTVPNSKMTNSCVDNISARPTRKRVYTIGITYTSGYDKMKKGLEILREIHQKTEEIKNCLAYFKEFGPHSLDILVISWCAELDYQKYLTIQENINLETMRRFEEEQIEFAFPTQTVYLKKE